MKNIVLVFMIISIAGSGCKKLNRSSSNTIDTLFADTAIAEEEPIDSAALFDEIESYRVESEPIVQDPGPVERANDYYMIVGCFSIPANAETFAGELRDQGYNVSILTGSNNLQMVAAGSYGTYQESIAEIEKFRIEVNPDAWVYVRR